MTRFFSIIEQILRNIKKYANAEKKKYKKKKIKYEKMDGRGEQFISGGLQSLSIEIFSKE